MNVLLLILLFAAVMFAGIAAARPGVRVGLGWIAVGLIAAVLFLERLPL